jgi:hypothetical protein
MVAYNFEGKGSCSGFLGISGIPIFIDYPKPIKPTQTTQQPWICPRCTKVNAPWVPSYCTNGNKETITSNGVPPCL